MFIIEYKSFSFVSMNLSFVSVSNCVWDEAELILKAVLFDISESRIILSFINFEGECPLFLCALARDSRGDLEKTGPHRAHGEHGEKDEKA
jgi:hypothetical protein